jgi:hypothetical protein
VRLLPGVGVINCRRFNKLGVCTCIRPVVPDEAKRAAFPDRLGLAIVIVWHNAEHYGQMVLYLRKTISSRQPAALIRRN